MGDVKLRDLSKPVIRKYKTRRRKKAKDNTIIRELGVFSTALNYCVDEELVWGVDLKAIEKLEIKKPKLIRRTYCPLNSEFDAIMLELKKMKKEYLVNFCTGLKLTAYRRGELEQLQFMDVDLNSKPQCRLNITKTLEPRNTPMYSKLFEHMLKQKKDAQKAFGKLNVNDVYVYREADGKTPIIRKSTYYWWKKAQMKAGCTIIKNKKSKHKFVFHDLRRFGVKYLTEKNFNRNIIMRYYTGHEDVEMFEKNYNIKDADTDRSDLKKIYAA